AAKKAERRGEWSKALRAWKAAYAKEGNPEYLIAIGDACSRLGRTAEARKSYERYLSDPLARPSNLAKVNARIAQLSAPPELPGAARAPAVALALKKEVVPPLPLPAPQPKAARAEPIAPAPSEPPPPLVKESLPPSMKLAVAAPAPDRQAPMAAVA